MSKSSVVIIGAGLGGLSAAIRLAASGVSRVLIFEKNGNIGGKVNLHEAAEYSFDTGASLLTMRHVVEDLFACCSKRLEDYLTLQPLEPICRYTWSDGARLDASANLERTEHEIARLEPRDVESFRRYLNAAKRKYEVAERTFLKYSLNDLPKLLRPRYARDLTLLSSWQTLARYNQKHFTSDYLQQLFNRFATYNGSSPYQTPATFALIPYVEFGLGAWYVKGGMYKLPLALARLARELGVEIYTNTEVASIVIERGQARGVRIKNCNVANGFAHNEETENVCAKDAADETDFVAADFVIANSDAIETYRRLIDTDARRIFTNKKLARTEPSCSGFVLLLGVKRRYEHLAHHNIFFSNDYPREFKQIFEDLRPADNPTIYVCATSRTDASQAPEGCENLFVLINAPATSDKVDWKREKQAYRDLIIKRLEAFGLENLNAAIEYEHVITPEDFAAKYHAHRGSIYGVSSNGILSAFCRPPNKPRDIENLYFAGGATHPGGGIPLVLLSGKMAAELIQKKVSRKQS